MKTRELDIFEIIRIIMKNRRFIILVVLGVSILAVIYSLLTPIIWQSQGSFYAVSNSPANSMIALSGFNSLESSLLGLDNETEAINFITIMDSRTFKEDVIRRFNLTSYFKLKNQDSLVNIDKALVKMNRIVSLHLGEKSSLVTIGAQTKSKKLSRDIVEYYLERLDKYNRLQKVTKGRRNREFLEKRIGEMKTEVDSLLKANRIFQEKNKAINLDVQSNEIIAAYSQSIAEKVKADIDLDMARLSYKEESPLVIQLKNKRDALAKQIRDLESDKSGMKPKYQIDISSIPSLAVQKAQLQMDLEVAQQILEYMYPQYEAAKLEEMRDMPTIEMVDSPREAGVRIRPKRAIICIISFFAALVSAIVIVFLKELLSKYKNQFAEIGKSIHD